MSFITFPGEENVPTTFAELTKAAENEDYTISTHTSIKNNILKSTDSKAMALKRLIESNKFTYPRFDKNFGVKMMREKVAFITFDILMRLKLNPLGIENFLISKEQLYSTNIGFGIDKKFLYKKKIDKVILRLFEAGITTMFENDELRKLSENRPSHSENSETKDVLICMMTAILSSQINKHHQMLPSWKIAVILKTEMKNSLKNVTLAVLTTEIPGLLQLDENKEKFVNIGIMSRIFLVLVEYLGFNYEIKKGKWKDIKYFFGNKSVDIVIPKSQTFERYKYMDFSYIITVNPVKLVIGKPAQLSKLTAVIRPFSFQMWLLTLCVFIICVILFTIIFRKYEELHKRKHPKAYDIAWALFGSFCDQGNQLFSPSGNSCRMIVSGWMFAIFIFTASYSGALMSFITFPGYENVPRTFTELVKTAKTGKYTISLNPHNSIYGVILQSTEGTGLALKKLIESNKFTYSQLDKNFAIRLMTESVGYITFDLYMKLNLSPLGIENFLISTDQLYVNTIALGIIKKFPYKKNIDKVIVRLFESGIIMKFENDEVKKKSVNRLSHSENSETKHVLNMYDLVGPFLITVVGYILSLVILFFEYFAVYVYRHFF
ncbi:ionotropic receptor 93a-like [Centruroides vittatus]|uniref:ionotropic receptor 93a-like n=1 Tax=Centruroides vittatus TaxID=120091 RepID=UPI0035104B14